MNPYQMMGNMYGMQMQKSIMNMGYGGYNVPPINQQNDELKLIILNNSTYDTLTKAISTNRDIRTTFLKKVIEESISKRLIVDDAIWNKKCIIDSFDAFKQFTKSALDDYEIDLNKYFIYKIVFGKVVDDTIEKVSFTVDRDDINIPLTMKIKYFLLGKGIDSIDYFDYVGLLVDINDGNSYYIILGTNPSLREEIIKKKYEKIEHEQEFEQAVQQKAVEIAKSWLSDEIDESDNKQQTEVVKNKAEPNIIISKPDNNDIVSGDGSPL